MIAKVIDLNPTDAFVSFSDGRTMDIGRSRLPRNVNVGDIINIDISTTNTSIPNITNDRLIDYF